MNLNAPDAITQMVRLSPSGMLNVLHDAARLGDHQACLQLIRHLPFDEPDVMEPRKVLHRQLYESRLGQRHKDVVTTFLQAAYFGLRVAQIHAGDDLRTFKHLDHMDLAMHSKGFKDVISLPVTDPVLRENIQEMISIVNRQGSVRDRVEQLFMVGACFDDRELISMAMEGVSLADIAGHEFPNQRQSFDPRSQVNAIDHALMSRNLSFLEEIASRYTGPELSDYFLSDGMRIENFELACENAETFIKRRQLSGDVIDYTRVVQNFPLDDPENASRFALAVDTIVSKVDHPLFEPTRLNVAHYFLQNALNGEGIEPSHARTFLAQICGEKLWGQLQSAPSIDLDLNDQAQQEMLKSIAEFFRFAMSDMNTDFLDLIHPGWIHALEERHRLETAQHLSYGDSLRTNFHLLKPYESGEADDRVARKMIDTFFWLQNKGLRTDYSSGSSIEMQDVPHGLAENGFLKTVIMLVDAGYDPMTKNAEDKNLVESMAREKRDEFEAFIHARAARGIFQGILKQSKETHP